MEGYQQKIIKLLEAALAEDGYKEDVTSNILFDQKQILSGSFIVHNSGVVSGIEIVSMIFTMVNPKIKINILKESGTYVNRGDVIAAVEGPIRDILTTMQVALNVLQRMSGIASTTNRYVKEIASTTCKIIDTRNTTPNLRILEKRAVVDGGGYNGNFSLSERISITSNHVASFGSIKKAVDKVLSAARQKNLLIEVEVENRYEFLEALDTDCDIIMMNNMTDSEMMEMVKINDSSKKLIANGKISLGRVRQTALTGVDYISLEAITNSFKSLDIELKFYKGL